MKAWCCAVRVRIRAWPKSRPSRPHFKALQRDIARIEAPGTLDGGDVLRVGRLLLAGRSTRSNDDGLRQLADAVAP